MLVLSRKVGQRLVIDDNITIVINRIAGNRVQIGIEAPDEVHIMRGELDKIRRQFSDSDQATRQEPVPMTVVGEFDSSVEVTPRSVH
ncbi:MAG: carbon storage regulator [Planctomycetaceae bacterium]|nr:carbon storage regulator [Planctomycetales bacterium]MCB9875077.1 carbon storage regulator [Planctomycetaceae bacterium]MCB9941054.1 carbon storage regulator [Planctomycetaceae bacterium]HRX79115.1 carbon storage regulator [Pirellulaceae bacterium]